MSDEREDPTPCPGRPSDEPPGLRVGGWGSRRLPQRDRPGSFAWQTPEEMRAFVRRALLDRLEAITADHLPAVADQLGLRADAAAGVLRLVSMVLFPEEFAEDPAAARELDRLRADRVGLVPDVGVPRCGARREAAYADGLRRLAEAVAGR